MPDYGFRPVTAADLPMLAEWLDKNFPPMVEDLVRQEIARIVKKQG